MVNPISQIEQLKAKYSENWP